MNEVCLTIEGMVGSVFQERTQRSDQLVKLIYSYLAEIIQGKDDEITRLRHQVALAEGALTLLLRLAPSLMRPIDPPGTHNE